MRRKRMKRQGRWFLTVWTVIGIGSLFLASQDMSRGLTRMGTSRTWTVCAQGCDFASIQQAIEAASNGDRIWIQPGIYTEHVVLHKSLTLEGSGADKTILKGAQPEKPILFIPEAVQVHLANLAIIESLNYSDLYTPCNTVGKCLAGIEVGGQAQLSLSHVQLYNHVVGIWIHGPAQVQLFASQIGSSSIAGIQLSHSEAELLVMDTKISVGFSPSWLYYEWSGIWAFSYRQIIVMNSTFSRSDRAIYIQNQGEISLIGVQFLMDFRRPAVTIDNQYSDNQVRAVILNSEFTGRGLEAVGNSQITVINSHFRAGEVNVSLGDQVHAVIQESELVGDSDSIDDNSGVVIWSNSAQVHLENNVIADHKDWGVALTQCYSRYIRVTPQITGRNNEIPEKDQPRANKQGALCPPDYPWPPGFRK
jgi:hypothetical protein